MTKYNMFDDSYRPEVLLDALCDRAKLRRDAQIARLLGFGGPVISKIRNKKVPIGADFLIRVQDIFGVDIDLSRKIAGIPVTPGPKATVGRQGYIPPLEDKED